MKGNGWLIRRSQGLISAGGVGTLGGRRLRFAMTQSLDDIVLGGGNLKRGEFNVEFPFEFGDVCFNIFLNDSAFTSSSSIIQSFMLGS